LTDIAFADCDGQQIRKQIWSAGKGWYAKPGQRRSVLMVVRWRARVGERQ
jgi:hypothetical protein